MRFPRFFRSVTVAALMIAGAVSSSAQMYEPATETLRYKVTYKWGIITKQAGTVSLTTHDFSNGYFQSTLIGTSATWADHFYSVRDTLRGKIFTASLEPVYYEKIAREDGQFKRDVIIYDRSGDSVKGDCSRWRQKKAGQPIVESHTSLEGTGITLDMLSSFYYMRHIDYPDMKPGQSLSMNVFSGQKKETLTITYVSNKTVEVEGNKYDCYYIRFSFTGDAGKKTSDDMYAWITRDSRRIPVMLLGNLPIGSIRCYYQP